MNITLGCDPELFLKDSATGKIVSAEGLIGGTKEEPRPISKKNRGFAVQEDNIMVEFNIPPAKTNQEFKDNINFVLNYLNKELKIKGYKLECKASHLMDKKFLQTDQAKTFGCEPDYNVYLQDINPEIGDVGRLRSCGGHIHIGGYDPTEERTERVIKAMDIFLGLPSVWLDSDTRRRRMYGTAGSFRFKPFGCEYRSLSNFWTGSDELMTWAFDNTILAVNTALNYDLGGLDEYNGQIREAINNSDVDLAKAVYAELMEEIKEITVNKQLKKVI